MQQSTEFVNDETKYEDATKCEDEPKVASPLPIPQPELFDDRKPAKCYYNKRVVPGHAGKISYAIVFNAQ